MNTNIIKKLEEYNEQVSKFKSDSETLIESDKKKYIEDIKLFFKEDMNNLKPKKLPFYEKYLFRLKKWYYLRKI